MKPLQNKYSAMAAVFALAAGVTLFVTLTLVPGEKRAGSVVAEDGAWSWFQDPRAVFIRGEKAQTITNYITRSGTLMVASVNHGDGSHQYYETKPDWGVDDHNVGSFLVLPDKRIMHFYAKHNGDGLFAKISTTPESIINWNDEVIITSQSRITYTHPVYLEDEGLIYVFWRGANWKPMFSTSQDGMSWSEPRTLLLDKSNPGNEVRPYLKVASDGKSAIFFAFTNGHPRKEAANSIFFAKYQSGGLFRADGTEIGTIQDLPLQLTRASAVYDADKSGNRAWIWDIAIDSDDRPAIVYAVFPSERDHRYYYSRWDGAEWHTHEIVQAGRWFPDTPSGQDEREPHYSGGITLHPDNPSVVFLSRQVRGVFEIERWETADLGANWVREAVTSRSSRNNIRPVVPQGLDRDSRHVLWLTGRYSHYTRFETGISYMELRQPDR
jgi:hypothetical protein